MGEYFKGVDGIVNLMVIVISIFVGIATFFLFGQMATFSEKLAYAFIVGVSTWLMLFIFMWTLLWLIRGIRK